MSKTLDRIYAHSPIWLQNVGISLYGLMWRHRRFGGNFARYVTEFQARESFTAEQWRAYQTEQLRLLLVHARRHVPHYTELFAGLRLSDDDLSRFSLDDLPTLPMLEKEQIRNEPERFVSRSVPLHHLNHYHTSGTTGTPLTVLRATDTDHKIQALYEVRVRNWAGLNRKMSRAMFGGRIIVPRAHDRGPFWRHNLIERQLYMSVFHISPSNVAAYVDILNRFRPDYLVGYACSQHILARMIAEHGLEIYRPRAILTTSEKLTPEMRETISEVFGCPVYDGYSAYEACCHISECEHHTLHESPDMGIIELLDEAGQPAKEGDYGEIVATGLLNFDQPLIRYRTGDLTIRATGSCACGRAMPTYQELIGRLDDIVVSADGREIVRFSGIFKELPHVREGQIVQKTVTDFLVRIAITEGFTEDEKATIHNRLHTRLGPVNLEFEYVEEIERTLRGKFRAVISHVKRAPQP